MFFFYQFGVTAVRYTTSAKAARGQVANEAYRNHLCQANSWSMAAIKRPDQFQQGQPNKTGAQAVWPVASVVNKFKAETSPWAARLMTYTALSDFQLITNTQRLTRCTHPNTKPIPFYKLCFSLQRTCGHLPSFLIFIFFSEHPEACNYPNSTVMNLKGIAKNYNSVLFSP